MNVTLPLRIESTANLRESWRRKARRARADRLAMIAIPRHKLPPFPLTVTLTRIAPRMMDGDNLQGGFKAIRDGVADAMGVKDNDPRVTWRYAQERGKPKEYACRIEIEIDDEVAKLRRAEL